MIRLTAMLRRNPALSAAEFHRLWRDVHADVIRTTPGVGERVARYEQHPRLGAGGAGGDGGAGVGRDRWTGSDGFDGVTVQWYRGLDDFEAMLRAPAYQEVVAPDERRLLDLDGSVYLLTEEPRIIIPG
jgi:hypothetical protein